MVLVGLLRHYVMQLMDSPPKPQPLKAVREQRALTRGVILRLNGHHLPKSVFEARRTELIAGYDSGKYLKEPPAADGTVSAQPPNPMDPAMMEGMMGGMKKQMVMFIPQSVLMAWINYFFTGFILIKLPFPLTPKFKAMLQARIETQDMDVTWVSSLSLYFLCLFGLNSVYRLILGEENSADGANSMAAMGQMGGNMMPGQPPQNFAKLYTAEKESLQLVNHAGVIDDVEERFLNLYGVM